MNLPYFYAESISGVQELVELDESNSRHALLALRLQAGDELCLSNGNGVLYRGHITEARKRACLVKIDGEQTVARPGYPYLGISLLKNAARLEWLFEKAAEIGVAGIVPLLCERTERSHFRADRMKGILVSAMLQSQQAWLPELFPPVALDDWIESPGREFDLKWIAHCGPGQKQPLARLARLQQESRITLIGPEGDFTAKELQLAEANGFVPVTLGNNRLRTETAALLSVVLMNQA